MVKPPRLQFSTEDWEEGGLKFQRVFFLYVIKESNIESHFQMGEGETLSKLSGFTAETEASANQILQKNYGRFSEMQDRLGSRVPYTCMSVLERI